MTHPREHALGAPTRRAAFMSDGSASLTYAELEDRANGGARLIRSLGANRGDAIAVWLPNCLEVFEVFWAAQRAGVYLVPIAAGLTSGEALYILENCQAKVLIASREVPGLAGLGDMNGLQVLSRKEWRSGVANQVPEPVEDEAPGVPMLYSSGTTGRPKGVRLAMPTGLVTAPTELQGRIQANFGINADDIYLSPAPLYHAAPLLYCTACQRLGATVVVMPRFDPEGLLEAIQRFRITAVQMVPTMFVRLLRLPEETRTRYDLSSLRVVIHAAAPCPVPIKRAMMEWLGPIIHEYYSGSESPGATGIGPDEWLRKPGSVGQATKGTLHICAEDGRELPAGKEGVVYFEGGQAFEYLGDPDKTRDSRNPLHPTWVTLGDIGYVDEEGYLFLTDRSSNMIITGGVNVYPREIEDLLVSHPAVADAAVIGIPNADFGEEVKAVVQLQDPGDAGQDMEAALLAYCRANLAAVKCPRTVDFDVGLPRGDNGKLYKQRLRERYLRP